MYIYTNVFSESIDRSKYTYISIYKYPGSPFWDFERDGWHASVHHERYVYIYISIHTYVYNMPSFCRAVNVKRTHRPGNRSPAEIYYYILYQNRLSDINGLRVGQTELIMTKKI